MARAYACLSSHRSCWRPLSPKQGEYVKLESTAFFHEGPIPIEDTCEGVNSEAQATRGDHRPNVNGALRATPLGSRPVLEPGAGT